MTGEFDQSFLSLVGNAESLEAIIYSLAEGVVVADQQGRFVLLNPAARFILGVVETKQSPLAWPQVHVCYRPDGVTPFQYRELPVVQALAGEPVADTEMFILNPHRPPGVWVVASAIPLRNDTGELCGTVGMFRDVTNEKEIDARILMLTNAVEQTADSIVITGRDGLIEYVNPAFEKTTGYTREEVRGRSPSLLKSGVHDAAFYENLWNTILEGEVFRATIANRNKSGTIYFAEQTITPMRDSTGNITRFVSVIKDVTEQRRLQEQENQMTLARAVQQQFYALPPPKLDGFDLDGAAFPADATGGDYFDFVPLSGNCLGIVIGDVCGHGISSALLMVELRAYLRAFSLMSAEVGEILRLVNNALSLGLERNRYATLVLCRLDPASRSIVYASAGHVPGYVFDADGSIRLTLDSTDIPIGVLPEHSFKCSAGFTLERGEILAFLTDGITEAERPDESQFGIDRAVDFIRSHRGESAQQIVAGLYRSVRDFSGGLPQTDDITAVVCKVT